MGPNTLLCLYDFDGDLRLLRVDATSSFKPLPNDSPLRFIVLASPWLIDDANSGDWQAAYKYLTELSPNAFKRRSVPDFDLGVIRMCVDKEALAKRMALRMKLLLRTNSSE